jgi:adenylylsulfate reductase, subunit A
MAMTRPNVQHSTTDLLIIGGGTAGCMAALFAKRAAPSIAVTIAEKAHIRRSGCLAMGLNAVNAHLVTGTPEDYLGYVKHDNYDIVRDDLVLSIGRRLNSMTAEIERLGVPFVRTPGGEFLSRSARSILMHGEQLKPLLADAVAHAGVTVFNHSPVVRLLHNTHGEVCGALVYHMRTKEFSVIHARAVLICTGGATGIYRSSNPGLARTKTWYCPYNAGAGLAMGLRSGAEMTSFEMRFVALRTKDVIAPTGTLMLGTGMQQCNARGDTYTRQKEAMLGRKLTTCERLLFTIQEHKQGSGPCYVDISDLDQHGYDSLIESYLNMAPSIVLHLLKDSEHPLRRVEICGSEPCINGGHGMAGFWIDTHRRTSITGLYAAGDAAGGAPKKYITGCFAEAHMAVEHFLSCDTSGKKASPVADTDDALQDAARPLESDGDLSFTEVEERLQKIMEEYAGGSTQNYETSRDKLLLARTYLEDLEQRSLGMSAADPHALMRTHDTADRILLARVLVEHLLARRETRWPCYQTRLDYPLRNDLEFKVFINSRMQGDRIIVCKRNTEPPYACAPLEDE